MSAEMCEVCQRLISWPVPPHLQTWPAHNFSKINKWILCPSHCSTKVIHDHSFPVIPLPCHHILLFLPSKYMQCLNISPIFTTYTLIAATITTQTYYLITSSLRSMQTFFCEKPGGKYFRYCRPSGPCCNYSTLPQCESSLMQLNECGSVLIKLYVLKQEAGQI